MALQVLTSYELRGFKPHSWSEGLELVYDWVLQVLKLYQPSSQDDELLTIPERDMEESFPENTIGSELNRDPTEGALWILMAFYIISHPVSHELKTITMKSTDQQWQWLEN